MKGYVAMSWARKADDLLLPQLFSSALLRQGAQPFPTLLIENLRGSAPKFDLKGSEGRRQNNEESCSVERLAVDGRTLRDRGRPRDFARLGSAGVRAARRLLQEHHQSCVVRALFGMCGRRASGARVRVRVARASAAGGFV